MNYLCPLLLDWEEVFSLLLVSKGAYNSLLQHWGVAHIHYPCLHKVEQGVQRASQGPLGGSHVALSLVGLGVVKLSAEELA